MFGLKQSVIAAITIIGFICAGEIRPVMAQVSAKSSSNTTASCMNPKLDLMETALGLWLSGSQFPIKDQDSAHFWVTEIVDNHFDPCANLSWVILQGAERDQDFYYGQTNQEVVVETVLFFHQEELITAIDLVGGPKVNNVKIKNNKATVTFGLGNSSTTRNIQYTFTGDSMVRKTTSLPNRLSSVNIDFNRKPLGHDGIGRPLGNVNFKPADEVYTEDILATVNMGNSVLLCDFSLPASSHRIRNYPHASCTDQKNEPFPIVEDEYHSTKDLEVSPTGKANNAHIWFGMPGALITMYIPSEKPLDGQEDFPDESIIQVGPFFVDTRGDSVKISDNQMTVVLKNGVAKKEYKPLIELDKSRYPTNLDP